MAWCWGIRKCKVVKVQKARHTLPSICIASASQAGFLQETTSFMAACYGETKSSNDWCPSDGVEGLNWQSEYWFRSKASVTPQQISPFLFNATKRSQFHAYIWRHRDESSHPLLDLLEQGWMRGTVDNILTPVMLHKSSGHLQLTTSGRCSSFRVRTEDQFEAHSYHMRPHVGPTVLCRCDGVMNVLITVVMLLNKCHIQIMIWKMNTITEAQCYVHII